MTENLKKDKVSIAARPLTSALQSPVPKSSTEPENIKLTYYQLKKLTSASKTLGAEFKNRTKHTHDRKLFFGLL